MKTTAMCFSLLQFPQCRIHLLANPWLESFHKLGRGSWGSSSFRILCSNNHEPEGGHSRKWTKRTINSKAEGHNESIISKGSVPAGYKLETTKVQTSRKISIGDKVVSRNTKPKLNPFEVESSEIDQYCNEMAKLATIICFDIETTGLARDKNRIIEIAFQDLRGGQNSTFQTFVNPERYVPNKGIHGISTRMVNRRDVPRMKDLIPILLRYIKSRQLPGGIVVLVAHNGNTFDVPFLKAEFSRCNYEIPEDWLFFDTMDLGRAILKAKGTKKVPSKISLKALREHYDIPLIGQAHRAMSDVHVLALVLQRLTHDLKLSTAALIKWSFKKGTHKK